MRQGTVSVLVGCHSVIHSMLVIIAWKHLYGKFPSWWEFGCIFLHDLGHWGKDYLDDIEQKRQHWKLGADIAEKLFGEKGFNLVAGHDGYSGYPESKLLKPDKYSFLIAPRLWLLSNLFAEPKIRTNNFSRWEHLKRFQEEVRKSIESGQFRSSHDIREEQEAWNEKDTITD